MGFYDLNIPVENLSNDHRLKLVTKLMELGYSGVAYNHFIKGSASLSVPICNPLPLASLVKASKVLYESIKFHREVLGVSPHEPFRQYTRVTLALENMIQMSAINSANKTLKSFDIVAVRPLNQTIFDHACKKLEVDLISVDFRGKIPFQIKKTTVKAAIERGVFMEIMYSPVISNLNARRETFANVKMLIEWTRGRNVVISSGASSVNELRGPYDVANLSTLFGLSTEQAKPAVSKNCKSLILHGLARKRDLPSKIQINNCSPSGDIGSNEAWIKVSDVWDPLSSGDGDVVLNADMFENLQSTLLSKRTQRVASSHTVSMASSNANSGLLLTNECAKLSSDVDSKGFHGYKQASSSTEFATSRIQDRNKKARVSNTDEAWINVSDTWNPASDGDCDVAFKADIFETMTSEVKRQGDSPVPLASCDVKSTHMSTDEHGRMASILDSKPQSLLDSQLAETVALNESTDIPQTNGLGLSETGTRDTMMETIGSVDDTVVETLVTRPDNSDQPNKGFNCSGISEPSISAHVLTTASDTRHSFSDESGELSKSKQGIVQNLTEEKPFSLPFNKSVDIKGKLECTRPLETLLPDDNKTLPMTTEGTSSLKNEGSALPCPVAHLPEVDTSVVEKDLNQPITFETREAAEFKSDTDNNAFKQSCLSVASTDIGHSCDQLIVVRKDDAFDTNGNAFPASIEKENATRKRCHSAYGRRMEGTVLGLNDYADDSDLHMRQSKTQKVSFMANKLSNNAEFKPEATQEGNLEGCAIRGATAMQHRLKPARRGGRSQQRTLKASFYPFGSIVKSMFFRRSRLVKRINARKKKLDV